MLFQSLGRAETNVDRAARKMVEAILDGRLSTASNLPPERRLAEDLGINRGTVRSALNRLGALGLVEPRHGAGYRVLDFRRTAGPALLGLWLKTIVRSEQLEAVFADLLAVRRALAAVVVPRLQHADETDIRDIESRIQKLEDAVNSGASSERIAQLDIEIIAAIVDSTGSLVFSLFLNPISQLIESLSDLRAAIYSKPRQNIHAYRMVLTAVRESNPDLVELLMSALEHRDRETLRAWKEARRT